MTSAGKKRDLGFKLDDLMRQGEEAAAKIGVVIASSPELANARMQQETDIAATDGCHDTGELQTSAVVRSPIKLKRLTLFLPADSIRQLKMQALEKGMSVSNLVASALLKA